MQTLHSFGHKISGRMSFTAFLYWVSDLRKMTLSFYKHTPALRELSLKKRNFAKIMDYYNI